MNIKFTDEKLFETLKASAIAICPVGSRAYGTNNEHSDYDFLYIYPTPKQELYSVFQSHHQLQYKSDDRTDHLFVSFRSFIANLVSGDSVLNFEALHTMEMRSNSLLSTIARSDFMFNSERLVRMYLGRARKDYKDFLRLENGGTKVKKLAHMVRSYFFADAIYKQEFRLDSGEFRAYLTKVTGCTEERREFYANHFMAQIDFLRDKLENEKSQIAVFMDIRHQKIIDSLVRNIVKSGDYKRLRKTLEPFDMSVFYHANEKGIAYTS